MEMEFQTGKSTVDPNCWKHEHILDANGDVVRKKPKRGAEVQQHFLTPAAGPKRYRPMVQITDRAQGEDSLHGGGGGVPIDVTATPQADALYTRDQLSWGLSDLILMVQDQKATIDKINRTVKKMSAKTELLESDTGGGKNKAETEPVSLGSSSSTIGVTDDSAITSPSVCRTSPGKTDLFDKQVDELFTDPDVVAALATLSKFQEAQKPDPVTLSC